MNSPVVKKSDHNGQDDPLNELLRFSEEINPPASVDGPDFERHSLSNGAEVSVISMPGAEQISIGAFIYCPVEVEREGEDGIRHFCEHMFASGTSELNDMWAVVGKFVELDTFPKFRTGPEGIVLSVTVDKEHFDEAIELVSSMLLRSTFHPENIEYQQAQVADEYRARQNLDGVLKLIVDDRDTRIMMRLSLGMEGRETVDFSREQLMNFIDREMSLTSLKLTVAGDVGSEVVAPMERCFGQAEAYTGVMRAASTEPEAHEETDSIIKMFLASAVNGITSEDQGVAPVSFGPNMVGAAFSAQLKPDVPAEALRLAEAIFREEIAGRLQRDGIVSGAHVSAGIADDFEVASIVLLYTAPGDERQAFDQICREIAIFPPAITDDIVVACRTRRTDELNRQSQSAEDVCERQLQRIMEGIDEGPIQHALSELQSVTPDQVRAVFAQVFNLDNMKAAVTSLPDQSW